MGEWPQKHCEPWISTDKLVAHGLEMKSFLLALHLNDTFPEYLQISLFRTEE